jgi:hypothetical protein
MAFLYAPDGKHENLQLHVSDQQEKYLAMEQVADRVRLIGADQLFYITETWHAPDDASKPDQRASESAEREEALLFVAVTARGPARSRQWFIPFSKGPNGETVLGETHEMGIEAPLFLVPVFAAWAELWPDDCQTAQETPLRGSRTYVKVPPAEPS